MDTISTMKKGSFVLNGKLSTFTVEDVEYRASEFGVHCVGFGCLTLNETIQFNSLIEMGDTLAEKWVAEIMAELHGIAQEIAFEERNEFLAKRAAHIRN